MPEKLDLSKQVVDSEGRPTAYLEDIISQLVDAVGGENALPVAEQIALGQNPALLAQIKANR